MFKHLFIIAFILSLPVSSQAGTITCLDNGNGNIVFSLYSKLKNECFNALDKGVSMNFIERKDKITFLKLDVEDEQMIGNNKVIPYTAEASILKYNNRSNLYTKPERKIKYRGSYSSRIPKPLLPPTPVTPTLGNAPNSQVKS